MTDDSDDSSTPGGIVLAAPSYPPLRLTVRPALPVGTEGAWGASDGGIDGWQPGWSAHRDALYPNDWRLPWTLANDALFPDDWQPHGPASPPPGTGASGIDDWQPVPVAKWSAPAPRSSPGFPLPPPQAAWDPPIFLKNYLPGQPNDPWNNQTPPASSTPLTWDPSQSLLYGIAKLRDAPGFDDPQHASLGLIPELKSPPYVGPGIVRAPEGYRPPPSPGMSSNHLFDPSSTFAPYVPLAAPISWLRAPDHTSVAPNNADLAQPSAPTTPWFKSPSDEIKGLPHALILGPADFASLGEGALRNENLEALAYDPYATDGDWARVLGRQPEPPEQIATDFESSVFGHELPEGGAVTTAIGRAITNPINSLGPEGFAFKPLQIAGSAIGQLIGGQGGEAIGGPIGRFIGSLLGGAAAGKIGTRGGTGNAALRGGQAATDGAERAAAEAEQGIAGQTTSGTNPSSGGIPPISDPYLPGIIATPSAGEHRLPAAERADQLAAALGKSRGRITIGVTETKEGARIISSSEDTVRRPVRKLMTDGELAASGSGDAEVTGIKEAKRLGLTPTGTAASRPICDDCAQFMLDERVQPLSRLKNLSRWRGVW